MVQGYYSLEEASQILGMSSEQLSQLAQRREVRAFADRGTWRFRTQDVEELARQRGRGSEPDLQFNDPPRSRQESPRPQKRPPLADSDAPLQLTGDDDQVEIGREPTGRSSGDSGRMKGKSGPKTPKPGSDSDVRLVPEGSGLGFQIASDSDVKVEDGGPKSGKKNVPPERKSDSSVRIVPMESDSDVKIPPEDSVVRLADEPGKPGTDSDIRLETAGGTRPAPKLPPASDHGDDSVLTEEIDLDDELRRKEDASKARKKKTQAGPSSTGKTPKPGAGPKKLTDSSSDFELTSLGKSDQPTREEEVDLGVGPTGSPTRPGHDSGIRLHDPKDSGISLEDTGEGSSELDFELSPATGNTPKPAKKGAPKAKEDDSDSEFELTLDDSGLKPIDSDSRGPSDSDKDIFETDFEVPALDDDSGSEAVALDESDTDLESSDFELAIGDDDMAVEDESGSQVVALDDEEADEAAATVARARRGGRAKKLVADEDEEAFEEIDEDEGRPVRGAPAVAAEQSWGLMVPIVAGFTFLFIFIGGLMSYELVHSMWGYRQSNKVGAVVVDPLTQALMPDGYLPKDR